MLGGSTIGAAGALSLNNSSYSNERPSSGLDVEFASDPASGGFFHADYKKHDDLKQMLDGNKDNLKLEAMKRIISMVAKGRDASELFPAVVKNVVSKNIEVKKLVYVYLVRYAEEQQDLALLSISTFQRALKDPNQLIRASALRVLSSIRVPMIVPIVMLAIRDSAADMSPYVRKTAAHAIPKLYSLDVEQKEELITVIEKLLSDRTTLVVGSAVMAFEDVCPERVDLIHKNYRKLCNLLIDVDEWGQVIIINMLTRYARTQFTDPNADDRYGSCATDGDDQANRPFYDETSSDESEGGDDEDNNKNKKSAQSPKKGMGSSYSLDPDHRLLLRQTKPLLQSRNASVVMIVAQLYHHVAPRNEVSIVAKALIRLLRSYKEVQSVVLTCIASMSTQRKSIFEMYLKSFFVRSNDATHIKLLKLEILTNLATAASIPVILREFQTYISSSDKSFVAATIQAIGRCASSIKEVTETCLSGLVHLLSNRDEYVVAESVVVIKNLLQTQAADHFDIISQMAKLIDFITVAAARASILWLIGEYSEKVPNIAPDVLRKMAKSFVDEEDIVKLQILNLAVKLHLTNANQTELLCQYVFNLARYDQNYDIRDRARFLKQFVFPADGKSTILSRNARKIFLAAKPAPLLESKYHGREQFQLGSLSHYLNIRATGYHDLPMFPEVAPDSTVRNVEISPANDVVVEPIEHTGIGSSTRSHENHKSSSKSGKKGKSFYSDSEKSSSEYSSDDGDESGSEDNNDDDEEGSTESEGIGKKSSKSESTDEEGSSSDSDDDSESSSSSGSESDTSSSEEVEEEEEQEKNNTSKNFQKAKNLANQIDKSSTSNKPAATERSNLDLLLDLDDIVSSGPVMTPSLGGFLTPTPSNNFIGGLTAPGGIPSRFDLVGPSHIPSIVHELLNKTNGYGLQIYYRFTRAPHLFSAKMVSIELTFRNESHKVIENIRISQKSLPTGMELSEFAPVAKLSPGQGAQGIIGIDFNDSTQSVNFALESSAGASKITLKSSVGELIRSISITEATFKEEQAQLRGMNEHSATIETNIEKLSALRLKIFEVANVAAVNSLSQTDNLLLHFAGQTMTSKSLVLITAERKGDGKNLLVTVNCEKMVVGSMLLNEIKTALKN